VLSSDNFSVQGATGIVEFDSNGDRKITTENQDELGMLVQVRCDNRCTFVPLDY
jgi:branched-chain amino acid transport system substrate-binding protein